MKKLNDLKNKLSALEIKVEPINNEIRSLRDKIKEIEKDEEEKIKILNVSLVQKMENEYAHYIFVDMENSDDFREVVEDDGTLHISIGKIRGCFICNQDISKSEWNKQARPIIQRLGFKWSDLK